MLTFFLSHQQFDILKTHFELNKKRAVGGEDDRFLVIETQFNYAEPNLPFRNMFNFVTQIKRCLEVLEKVGHALPLQDVLNVDLFIENDSNADTDTFQFVFEKLPSSGDLYSPYSSGHHEGKIELISAPYQREGKWVALAKMEGTHFLFDLHGGVITDEKGDIIRATDN
jgi:hypothetical protein